MLPEEYCLTVVVVGATNLKNVSTFGKLDPFVEITYGNEVYKTSVIKDGGCSPVWNYEVCLTGRVPYLKIDVMDSRLFKPKLIGSISIDLTTLAPGVQNIAYNLYNDVDKKECTGILLTKITVFSLYREVPTNRPRQQSYSPHQQSYSPHIGSAYLSHPRFVQSQYNVSYGQSLTYPSLSCSCAHVANPFPTVYPQMPHSSSLSSLPRHSPMHRYPSSDGSRFYSVSRGSSMTPEMFPIIP